MILELQEDNAALRQEIAALERYRALAYRDPLTGLRNRRYCIERLSEELDRAKRVEGGQFSVLVLDLNNLKIINDNYGHASGDRALLSMAQSLEQAVRTHDACCRTGGDEFTLILPNADEGGRRAVSRRLMEITTKANASSKLPYKIDFAIGGATWPGNGYTAERLLYVADARMYENKPTRSGHLRRVS